MDDDIHSDHSYLDTLGIPLNSTLNHLVILHLTSEIVCFHRYWNSASRTPSCLLNCHIILLHVVL